MALACRMRSGSHTCTMHVLCILHLATFGLADAGLILSAHPPQHIPSKQMMPLIMPSN